MDVFLLWFIFAIVVAVGAAARGRSGLAWFFVAMIISPLLAVILLFLMPVVTEQPAGPTPDTHVKCPDCAELVLKEARVCKHCGCRLTPEADAPKPTIEKDPFLG